MEKRGMGHVEVILAFVLFISAIVFILSFVDFDADTKTEEAALAYVTSRIEEASTTRVIMHTVSIQSMSGDPAQPTPQVLTLELPEELPAEYGLRVEAVTSGAPQKLQAQKHPANPQQIVVDRGTGRATLVRIILSMEITAMAASLTPPVHDPSAYKFLSRSEKELLAERKLRSLSEAYAANYGTFRESLAIASRINTAFSASWPNPEAAKQDFIKAERDIPSRVDVIAHNLRQEMLLPDGQRVFADVIIRVW